MNVLLIVIDALRADHLGCYGYFRDTSPNIDRLASEGTLFEEFYASGEGTGTAFTSIHTGLYPVHHSMGKVFDVLEEEKILEDTLIIVTADHGELLGQHDIYTHAYLYDPGIHIPLIVRYPSRFSQEQRVKGLAGQVDIFPTILGSADIPDVIQQDGVSLKPLTEGKKLREAIIAEDGGGKVNELRTELEQWVELSLQEGEEDPIKYICRNFDVKKHLKKLSMDLYFR